MSQREIFKGRLEYARSRLNGVLPRLTPEMLPWAPFEGMRTVAWQLVKIISVEAQLVPALKDGKLLPKDKISAIACEGNSLDELFTALAEVRKRTLECLDGLTEEDLMADVTLTRWYGTYWPKPSPWGGTLPKHC